MATRIRLLPTSAAALCLAGLAGCGSPEFAPVDAEPATPTELAASWQDVTIGGRDLGDVKVWSRGAPEHPAPRPDANRQVHVGLRIRNDSGAPMRLDLEASDMEVHTEKERMVVVDTPLEVRGRTEVAPGASERVELIYALPDGVKLRDVVGYELSWVIAVPAAAEGSLPAGARREPEAARQPVERRISRSTVFRRVRYDRRDYYYPYDRWSYPYYGFYDPWYPSYGLHWGYGARFGW